MNLRFPFRLRTALTALLLCVCVLLSPSLSALAASPNAVRVTGDPVNVRSGASTSASVIGKAHKGDRYLLLGQQKDSSGRQWYRVQFTSKKTGWLLASLATPVTVQTSAPEKLTTASTKPTAAKPTTASTTAAATRQVRITGGTINVRTGCNTTYGSIGIAHRGETYPLLGSKLSESGITWYKIQFTSSRAGWVSGKYAAVLQQTSPSPASPKPSSTTSRTTTTTTMPTSTTSLTTTTTTRPSSTTSRTTTTTARPTSTTSRTTATTARPTTTTSRTTATTTRPTSTTSRTTATTARPSSTTSRTTTTTARPTTTTSRTTTTTTMPTSTTSLTTTTTTRPTTTTSRTTATTRPTSTTSRTTATTTRPTSTTSRTTATTTRPTSTTSRTATTTSQPTSATSRTATTTSQPTSATSRTTTTTSKPMTTTTVPPSATQQRTVKVTGNSVNVRAGAGTSFPTLGTAYAGYTFRWLGSATGDNGKTWYRIQYTSSREGWISAAYSQVVLQSSLSPLSAPERKVQQIAQKYGAVGAQVAVVRNGRVTAAYHYGDAVKNSRRMTDDTKIRIASVSKVFVAMNAMKMQEEGIVSLDQDIGAYWKTQTCRPTTLRQLLTHTSYLRENSYRSSRENTAAQLADPDCFRGSCGWYYNNYAVGLAGSTLEVAADRSLNAYAREKFLTPLGIDASFTSGNLRDSGKLAALYKPGGSLSRSVSAAVTYRERPIGGNTAFFAGGLTISAKDMAKLTAILANDGVYDGKRYLSASSVSQMERVTASGYSRGHSFAQALPLRRLNNVYGQKTLYFHLGTAYGTLSFMGYNPDTRNGVVVITTGASGSYDTYGTFRVCAEMADYFLNI